ncbi:MAG: hypothetical protein II265_06825, partial [Clostridia bacterium]|nr:hypothetical protein [Clostridia bacterium]
MKRNKVPESVSSPTPGAQRAESRRRRVIDAQERERKLPSMSARDPVKDRPILTPEQRRDLLDGRRGQGSPDYMLGELMNPLVEASSFAFGGLPASGVAALKAAGLSVATMAGLERLSESSPKTAQLVNLGMLALAAPGMANSARRAGVKQLNDLLAEPTEQKLKLLYEMVKHRGVRRGNNPDALRKDLGQVLSNGTKGPQREPSQAWTDTITKDLDLMLSDAVSELHERASAQRMHRRTLNRDLRPMVHTQTPMQALKQLIWTHDAEDQQPVKQSRWYADLEKRYGKNRADRMARFVSSSDYADYFLAPGPKGELATDEIAKYAAGGKLINDITEPGEIVIGGSSGINLEGTISRETAVPHDLDFSGYIANASRRTDTPFFLKDGKPLSPQVRNEMFAALSNHDNIENAPLIQKLRSLRPELKDAPFRYARYDWEWGGGDQYKPGVFTVVKKPDIT